METEIINEEIDLLLRLIVLKNWGGITDEEWQKMLSTISDEAIILLAERRFYEEDAIEILIERMENWDADKLVETIETSDKGISKLANEVLIRKMIKWSNTDLEKAVQNDSVTIARVALEAEKGKREINRLREKLGLNPL